MEKKLMSTTDEEIRKYLQNKFDPQSQFEKLKSYKNAINLPQFATSASSQLQEQYNVNIKPDSKVAQGAFIPHPLIPNQYRAHPVTIKAMRKEIFMGGDEFVDLECLYTCASCKTQIDIQFWYFCPYCEASFPCK
jgi:hypothetical protein